MTAADWSVDIPEGARNVELTRRAGSLLAGGKMEPAEALTMLLAWNERHCKPPLPEDEVRAIVASIAKAEAGKKGRSTRSKAALSVAGDNVDTPQGARRVASPKEPLPNARAFLSERYTHESVRTLHFHQESFFAWNGTAYEEVEVARIRSELYQWLEAGFYFDDKGNLAPFNPNQSKVDQVVDALKAVTHLQASVQAPAWLGDEVPPYPAGEIIACRNGLLHVLTRTLLAHSPRFFNTFALPFDYDPEAPEPSEWLNFLRQLWGDDVESIQTLQEAMGYTLTADTSLQKAFLVVGPPRSGKGTIARVWRGLLGHVNVAGPTLSAFGTNFGLAPLIGKPLAIISDARLSGRTDQQAIVERLLSITGEDAITIDRKYKPHWTGQLPTRLVILTNELPRLADTSGALANRFIVLRLTRSWLGKEDPSLTGRLLRELPGILSWALDGLARLRERGYFVQPASSADVARELMELSSPITAFVREMCVIGSAYRVPADDLYEAWRTWCEANGRENRGTKQSFGRDLHAALPGLRIVRPREDGQQRRWYQGIGLLRRDETRLDPLYARVMDEAPPDPPAANGLGKSEENNGVSRVSPRLTPDLPPPPVDGEVRQAGPGRDGSATRGEAGKDGWVVGYV
jgi:putative DNA primase/helicase